MTDINSPILAQLEPNHFSFATSSLDKSPVSSKRTSIAFRKTLARAVIHASTDPKGRDVFARLSFCDHKLSNGGLLAVSEAAEEQRNVAHALIGHEGRLMSRADRSR